jgi:hypothetical protein
MFGFVASDNRSTLNVSGEKVILNSWLKFIRLNFIIFAIYNILMQDIAIVIVKYLVVSIGIWFVLSRWYGMDLMDIALVIGAIAVWNILSELLIRVGTESSEEGCACASKLAPKLEHFNLQEEAHHTDTKHQAKDEESADDVEEEEGDMKYNQLPARSMMPLAPKPVYGEVFVDPEAWYPPCLRPPICVTNSPCPVQPVYTQGTYIDLLEWDDSRRITAPDNIQTQYVNDVLNTGKVSKQSLMMPKKGAKSKKSVK